MTDPERLERLSAVQARIMGAAMDELKAGEISATELLAVLAYTTGACMAYQDRRTMTADQAVGLIQMNIEAGNVAAIASFASGAGLPGGVH